jgi:hypothetical protein
MNRLTVIVLLILIACPLVLAQDGADQPQHVSAYKTYVFMQAGAKPADRKGAEVLQKITDDLQRFLRENRVNMAGDPVRSDTDVPIETVLQNGKNLGAAAVLYSKIDVPGKTIRVKTAALALDGNTIWETTAGCDMADRVPLDVCLKVTLETLHETLKYRIKEQDLPVMASDKSQKD